MERTIPKKSSGLQQTNPNEQAQMSEPNEQSQAIKPNRTKSNNE